MASNHNQPLENANAPLDDSLDTLTNQQQQSELDSGIGGGGSSDGRDERRATNNGFYLATSGHKILNDAHLIRSRRTNFNQRARKGLELMCEDKVSRFKFEEVHCSVPSSNKSTFIMTFSPDGQRVASTHGDHRIYICDLNTGKLLDTLEGHPKTPWCLAWHPSNREILASGCLAGEVRVWDLRSKACESWTSENNSIITSLDFHPKERILVIAAANDILFWDWSESEPFAKTTTHDKEKVKFVEFDSSGTKLITGISNLPKFAGYSSDSLQNRIIDSYLTQGTLDQLQTDNMTQNSEITGPLSGSINSNEGYSERNPSHSTLNRQSSVPGTNNTNEQDINYRSTLTLSRVASLYRQLEALEDSMRHRTFSPYINARPINSANDRPSDDNPGGNQQSDSSAHSDQTMEVNANDQATTTTRETPPIQQAATSQDRINNTSSNQSLSDASTSSRATTRAAPNAFEPLVVSFDGSLENLHLMPLIIDGQTINPASVIEQYPIDLPYQLHHMMQVESINQVNQYFIRISKLMSSVRLYRQVVQQILSSNSGQGHYQPNQILTAQSASPRSSSRNTSNLPIVFRNFGSTIEAANNFSRTTRPTDPILAIRFRNNARNVPLVSSCTIDLLSARSICIMRSQQLIEQAISGHHRPLPPPPPSNNDETAGQSGARNNHGTDLSVPNQSQIETTDNAGANPSFYSLLNQLHQSLTVINHAPLTTSNVHTHISSLRSLINKLLTTLSSMLQTQEEGRRLIGLIHDIAHSLTGRNWNMPLGATLDDIRLDVVHTLCIVDLTLHLTRQVQLLQMQRLSALDRIEASRRASTASSSSNSNNNTDTTTDGGVAQEATSGATSAQMEIIEEDTSGPSTSGEGFSGSSLCKRKETESLLGNNESAKRKKVDHKQYQTNSDNERSNSGTDMIEPKQTTSSNTNQMVQQQNPNSSHSSSSTTTSQLTANQLPLAQSHSIMQSTLAESIVAPSTNPVVLWNSTHNQGVEQSLQRFLLATASSLNNSHILVRIYHRLHGSPTSMPGSGGLASDQPIERPNLPHESRRRALSQDNSAPPSASTQDGLSAAGGDSGRPNSRQNQPNYQPSPSSSGGGGGGSGGAGVGFEGFLQRHPHLHVYQTRGTGHHLWFNQWTIPLPMNNSNYRIQCWNFSLSALPNIKDSQSNIVTQKCRIHNDASIDISSDGGLIACLVPRDDGPCLPSFDLKIFSLRSFDFGVCYYQLPHGPNAISVSLSPSAGYAVVGLASHKFASNDPNDDDLTIAKVFKLNGRQSFGYVRDIKIKRDDSALSLNAIRWMERGIVYNIGPQHHQRYQATRMRNRVA